MAAEQSDVERYQSLQWEYYAHIRSFVPVDQLTIAERVKKLRQEISQIGMSIQAHREGFILSCACDTNMYEQRRQRLKKIKDELASLLHRRAA